MGGVIVFAAKDVPVLALGFAAVAVIAAIDSMIVVRHIRAGAHYQPGPDVPPYRPVDPAPQPRSHSSSRSRLAPARRLHWYLALMGVCLVLLLVAWIWVRMFSIGLAAGLTLVAMVIPPIAAIVANSGALQQHSSTEGNGKRPGRDGSGGRQ